MAFVVRLAEKNAFWTGNPEAVWSDDLTAAKEYKNKKEAESAIGTEIPTYYNIVAVDSASAEYVAPVEKTEETSD